MFEINKFVAVTLATLMVALPTTSCAPSGSDSAEAFSDALEAAGSGVPVLLPEEGTLLDIYSHNCPDASCRANVEAAAEFYQRQIDTNVNPFSQKLTNWDDYAAGFQAVRTFAERHGLVALIREVVGRVIGTETGLSIASQLIGSNGAALMTTSQPKARQLAVVDAFHNALMTGRAADGHAFIQATQNEFGIQHDPAIVEDLKAWGAQFSTELQKLVDQIFSGNDIDHAIASLTTAEQAGKGDKVLGGIRWGRAIVLALIGLALSIATLVGILQTIAKGAKEVKEAVNDVVGGLRADAARATRIAGEVEGSGCQWRDLAAPMQLTEAAAETQLIGVAPISLKAGSVALIVDPRDYEVIGDQPACTVYCVYAQEDAELEGTTGGEALCAEFAALASEDRYGWIDQHARTADGGFFVEVFQLPDLQAAP